MVTGKRLMYWWMGIVLVAFGVLITGSATQNCQAAPRDVQFKTVDFETSVIEIHNFGNTAEPFINWRLCYHDDNQFQLYSNIGALNPITLGAGESLFLHFDNDAPVGSANALNVSSLGPAATPLDRGPYSINLYLNSAFTIPSTMVDHVQWSINGADDFIADARSLVAQNADLWTNESEWVSTSTTTERLELILDNGDPPAGIHGPNSYAVIEPVPLSPADLDEDGDVDSDDLARWASAYAVGAGGDIDGDGDSDGLDFQVWQREYTGPSAVQLAAVPEPATSGLLLLGLAAICLTRR